VEGATAAGQTAAQRAALIRLLEDGTAWMWIRQLSQTVLQDTFLLK
jgi:hypothetical protein